MQAIRLPVWVRTRALDRVDDFFFLFCPCSVCLFLFSFVSAMACVFLGVSICEAQAKRKRTARTWRRAMQRERGLLCRYQSDVNCCSQQWPRVSSLLYILKLPAVEKKFCQKLFSALESQASLIRSIHSDHHDFIPNYGVSLGNPSQTQWRHFFFTFHSHSPWFLISFSSFQLL